jgi:hypothetical protein
MQQRHLDQIDRRFDVPTISVSISGTWRTGLDRLHGLVDQLFTLPSLVA